MAEEETVAPAVPESGETAAPEATPTPSATEQASADVEQPTAEPQTAPETPAKRDWRTLMREDAEAKRVIEEEANRIAQNIRNRERKAQQRELADQALKTNDGQKARTVLQQIVTEPDEDAQAFQTFRQRELEAAPLLNRLVKRDEYAAVYQREGKAAMDERYNADPIAFADWLDDQILEHRADQKAKSTAPVLAKAIATSDTAEALRRVPIPPIGTGTGRSIGRYTELTDAERRELKKTPEGRRKLDELVAREMR